MKEEHNPSSMALLGISWRQGGEAKKRTCEEQWAANIAYYQGRIWMDDLCPWVGEEGGIHNRIISFA